VALFSRRIIQRSLDFLRRRVLTPTQVKRLVSQLNSSTRHVISTEWEVVVVAAFAKHSSLQYEPQINEGFPDIKIENSGAEKDISFIAEVIAVSDYGTVEKNPSDYLYEKLLMMALKLGVNWSALGWHVGARMDGRYPDQRVKVMLPSKTVIHSRLQTSIRPFLTRVKDQPTKSDELVWNEPDVDFRLTYDPTQRHARFGGPLLATAPYSKTQNPLYRGLKSKAEQLSKTKCAGMRGIIVGDADCYCLQRTASSGGSYDSGSIIKAFLEKHSSVTFVTTSRYDNQTCYMTERGQYLRHAVYFREGVSDRTRRNLLHLLDDAFGDIPRPISSPANALRSVTGGRELSKGTRLGAYEWTPTRSLKIPVRVFLGLIANTITERDFDVLFYRTIPPNGGPLIAFFRTLLTAKVPIQGVFVEPLPNEDNDWIVFETGTTISAESHAHSGDASKSCQISSRDLIRYFAGLDYTMQSKRPNHSEFGTIPDAERIFVRTMLAQGRLLASARLETGGQVIRLLFGDVDAAMSRYR
jgi:hypothetical protein